MSEIQDEYPAISDIHALIQQDSDKFTKGQQIGSILGPNVKHFLIAELTSKRMLEIVKLMAPVKDIVAKVSDMFIRDDGDNEVQENLAKNMIAVYCITNNTQDNTDVVTYKNSAYDKHPNMLTLKKNMIGIIAARCMLNHNITWQNEAQFKLLCFIYANTAWRTAEICIDILNNKIDRTNRDIFRKSLKSVFHNPIELQKDIVQITIARTLVNQDNNGVKIPEPTTSNGAIPKVGDFHVSLLSVISNAVKNTFGGGISKALVLGRVRKVTRVGRKQMVTYKGNQISLSEARTIEKKLAKEKKERAKATVSKTNVAGKKQKASPKKKATRRQ